MYSTHKRFIILVLILLLLIIIALILRDTLKLNLVTDLNYKGAGEMTVEWTNKLVFKEEEINNIIQKIESNMHRFGPIRQSEMKKLINLSKIEKLPAGLFISIRNILSSQRAMNAMINMSKYRNQIKNDYKDISEKPRPNIAGFYNKYPLPPIQILKVIQEDNKDIPKSFTDYAYNNDFENPESFKKILQHSDLFEEELIKWFKDKYPKIQFKTQNELKEEQTAQFGRPMITPDILFLEPVLFKITNPDGTQFDQLIRWIDAKNFTLVDIPITIRSVKKQADKYFNKFGPGALVFNYGFTEGISILNTTILSFN